MIDPSVEAAAERVYNFLEARLEGVAGGSYDIAVITEFNGHPLRADDLAKLARVALGDTT